jgi:TPR repeat protein
LEAELLYQGGYGKEDKHGWRAMQRACALGHVEAVVRIGLEAWKRKDLEEAQRWLQKAAEAGHAAAMELMAACGACEGERFGWLRKAALAGRGMAMVTLGVWMRGAAMDGASGAAWFRKAAGAGDAVGMLHYGWALQLGDGVEMDWSAGAMWVRRGIELGAMEDKRMILV